MCAGETFHVAYTNAHRRAMTKKNVPIPHAARREFIPGWSRSSPSGSAGGSSGEGDGDDDNDDDGGGEGGSS